MPAIVRLFASCFALALTALPGFGASATEMSCAFVNGFQDSRASAAEALEDIFDHGDGQALNAVLGTLSSLPDRFDDGAVVEIANVGDFFAEHFIVLNSRKIGNIYFRIVYERVEIGMVGVKYVFNSDAEVALDDWPMLQNPVVLRC